jgi:hypothetical protein
VIEGGCLCGAVRYRITGEIIDSGYCHCRICQRSVGAPVLAWLTVKRADFAYTRGKPHGYRSSANVAREFCRICGTQMALQCEGKIDITSASLDDPSQRAPDYHIWRHSRVAWFETTDTLPRYDDSGPDWTPSGESGAAGDL